MVNINNELNSWPFSNFHSFKLDVKFSTKVLHFDYCLFFNENVLHSEGSLLRSDRKKLQFRIVGQGRWLVWEPMSNILKMKKSQNFHFLQKYFEILIWGWVGSHSLNLFYCVIEIIIILTETWIFISYELNNWINQKNNTHRICLMRVNLFNYEKSREI
jgi:hypothetical protein